jgi:hypothetical protein
MATVFRLIKNPNAKIVASPEVKQVYTSRSEVLDISKKNETTGRRAWRLLWQQQKPDPEWFDQNWKRYIPSGCGCRKGAETVLDQCPPRYDSEESWFAWKHEFHNLINAKLGKPTVSLDRARMLWQHVRPATRRTRAIITVANGTKFVELLKLTRPFMQAYSDRVDADLIDLDNDTEDWGPMEKFRTWHFTQEYDEVLFVDADCVIKPDAPNIFEQYTETICVHDDWSRLYKTEWLERERKTVAAKTGLDIQHTSQCLNSGVVLTRKDACDIWLKPAIDIGTTHCAEQIWLEHQIDNAWCSGATLAKLDPRWNWQWWFSTHDEGAFEAGLAEAWIVHFANAPDRVKLIGEYLATL